MDTSEYDFAQKAEIIFSMVFTSSYHFRECPKRGASKISMGTGVLTPTLSSAVSSECLCDPWNYFLSQVKVLR